MSDVIKTIRRNLALKEYDIKEKPDGKPVVFSIKFVKKNGELVFIAMATAAGLPFHAANNRMRGVRPVDSKLNQSGHIVAVDIDAIRFPCFIIDNQSFKGIGGSDNSPIRSECRVISPRCFLFPPYP